MTRPNVSWTAAHHGWRALVTALVVGFLSFVQCALPAHAQETLPWDPPPQGAQATPGRGGAADPYAPGRPYNPPPARRPPQQRNDNRAPRAPAPDYRAPDDRGAANRRYDPPPAPRQPNGYSGDPYDSDAPPRRRYASPETDPGDTGRDYDPGDRDDRETYTQNEIIRAGHGFFGAVSRGLADAIAYTFRRQGRPNGYILGEDAGGAFVAGLRYGEGRLYTKRWGGRKVFWQGPSVGYDFGGEGSKVMVLIYNLRHPRELFQRFGGVQGSAYLVGGVGVELQKRDHVTLAPIRAGVGLRFGANVGYLKYTRRPTWNPF